jgi:hypothetical protein
MLASMASDAILSATESTCIMLLCAMLQLVLLPEL